MRRFSSFHTRQSFMELKMTSLIDVVFQLLIFFVWTASFRTTEYVLPSQVSQAKATSGAGSVDQPPPPEADFPEVVVRIFWTDGQPGWFMNDEPITTLAGVRQKLTQVFAIVRNAPLIIHPEPAVPLGHVIDLYDLARQIGFEKVQFATSREL